MMEWLRDKVMWQRLTKMRYFSSSCCCRRRVSAQENPEKRRCFWIFDHKLTEEDKCETERYMEACEG